MRVFKVGTRASALALKQTQMTIERLLAFHPQLTQANFEIIKLVTKGDKILDRKLSEIGGKGLFTKEIEQAIVNKDIDFAVHSMKDMTSICDNALHFPAFLPRDIPNDALVSVKHKSITELEDGCVVGTSSIRRETIIKNLKPKVIIKNLRGNVLTRIEKLMSGEYDAIILSASGLERLNIDKKLYNIIDVNEMLPAPCQGVIAVEARKDDKVVNDLLENINHHITNIQVQAERGFMEHLNANCQTPIASFATLSDNNISLKAMLASDDMKQIFYDHFEGEIRDAYNLGVNLAEKLKMKLL